MRALRDFIGDWDLAREIEDRASGQTGRFTGIARLSPDAEGLVYSERGTLRLGAAPPIQAERSYLWRPAASGAIAVLFPDGRPFHEIAPGSRSEARHWCAPDNYGVAYDLTAWPRWQATWTVTGPRKDYTATSRYTPCAPRGAGAQHFPISDSSTETDP